MASVNQNQVAATKRLMKDLKEFRESPIPNVSAVPLDDNLFEWHCCVAVNDTVIHVILYFPDNYPHIGPAADFFPHGLRNPYGSSMSGKKGSAFCMSLLSNYSRYHSEWTTDEGYGWSPAYTVQSLLLNITAALTENNVTTCGQNTNLLEDKNLKCEDCGHTCEYPFPPLPELTCRPTPIQADDKTQTVTCYVSRQTFDPNQKPESNADLFGFGLDWHGKQERPYWSSPCETLSFESFQMMKNTIGHAHSSRKEEIKFFLPLYINPNHGNSIKDMFEETVQAMFAVRKTIAGTRQERNITELVLESLPNLMATTVEDFSNALEGSGDLLSGFFALHRLLLWAVDTYPGLQEVIEQQIQRFLSSDTNRTKKNCACPEEWLMLVSVSKTYRWEDVAAAYIIEVWHREIIEALRGDLSLGDPDVAASRAVDKSCKLMAKINKRLALQMVFLKVANPAGMSRETVVRRYDDNLGFPTADMKEEIRDGLAMARDAKTFADWFKIWNAEVSGEEEIRNILLDVVYFCIVTPGYAYPKRQTKYSWGRILKSGYTGQRRLNIKPKSDRSDGLSKAAQDVSSASTSRLPPANISTTNGTADAGPSSVPLGTCVVTENQGPQPMDTSETDERRSGFFARDVDPGDIAARPKLRPEMTLNCLDQLRAKRRREIFRPSIVAGRPRRIRSCHVF